MKIMYKWEPVEVTEDLRIEVLDYEDEQTLEKLLATRGGLSLQYDGRILSEYGAAWVYEVHHGATIEIQGVTLEFEFVDED